MHLATKYGPDKVADFIEMLKDGTGSYRSQALSCLGNVEPVQAAAAAIPLLIELWQTSRDVYERQSCVRLLARLPLADETVRILKEALVDRNEQIRGCAATAIPFNDAFLPEIMTALHDPVSHIRKAMISQLARMPQDKKDTQEFLQLVVDGLRDTDCFVRGEACRVVDSVGTNATNFGAELLRLLEIETDESVRWNAAGALVRTGGARPADLPNLVKYLRPDGRYFHIRSYAAQIIGQFGVQAKDAVPALIQAIELDPDVGVRAAAIEALGNIGADAEPALQTIVEILKDRTALVDSMGYSHRHQAADALGKIATADNQAVIGALTDALSDTNDRVRASAITALEALGVPKDKVARLANSQNAELTIADRLRDDDASVRNQALKELSLQVHKEKKETDWAPLMPALVAILREDKTNQLIALILIEQSGTAGRAALDVLLDKRKDASSHLSDYLSQALVAIAPDDPRVLEVIYETLMNTNRTKGADAAALAKAGVRGVPYLIAALDAPDTQTIYCAAGALQSLGETARDAVPALLNLVQTRRNLLGVWATCGVPSGLQAVLGALGAIAPNDKAVLDTISKISNEDDYISRSAALYGLEQMKTAQSQEEATRVRRVDILARSQNQADCEIHSALHRNQSNQPPPEIVFEIITRYALMKDIFHGVPWHEVCAKHMAAHNITQQQIESEVMRRKSS